jgi:hypothetical protein
MRDLQCELVVRERAHGGVHLGVQIAVESLQSCPATLPDLSYG